MKNEQMFSDELQVLMGEWLTYYVVNQYNLATSGDEGEVADSTFFENCVFSTARGGPFSDAHYFLDEVGVVQWENCPHTCTSACTYKTVRTTIHDNIYKIKYPVFSYFISMAEWNDCLTNCEREYFKIAVKCQPLFDAFIRENYVQNLDNRYYWTSKIRPLIERYSSYWNAPDFGPVDQQIKNLNQTYKDKLYELAVLGDRISALQLLGTLPNFSNHAYVPKEGEIKPQKLLERMFPQVWGKPIETKVWKWFGPD